MKQDKISRHVILETAKRLFTEEGYTQVSMRKVARAVGISPTTIYLYFENKAELMFAIHQEGFRVLNERFDTLQHVEEPFERLKAMGRVYIDFAIENPEYYAVMFDMKEPVDYLNSLNAEQEWIEGKVTFQQLADAVIDCQKEGYFHGYNPVKLSFLIWTNMMGLCSVINSGRLELVGKKMLDGNLMTTDIIQTQFDLYTEILAKL